MANIVLTVIVASIMMLGFMLLSVAVTMPFVGSLIRLRANYNPHGVGFDDTDNVVGPRLTSLFGTMKRTKRLEGWYGLYKGAFAMAAFLSLVSLSSIIFVGGLSHKRPNGTFVVPSGGAVGMTLFTIFLTLISLPMTIVVNRAVITPYRLPNNVRESLRILLSPHELERPVSLYLTPGLLIATVLRSICVTFVARGARHVLVGSMAHKDVHAGRLVLFMIFQLLATAWLAPLEVVQTKLSVQPNMGGEVSIEDPDAGAPEGLRFAGTDEDVVGLRPTADPYLGFVDCIRKIIEEEGWKTLYRGWWWTALSAVLAVR